MGPNKCQLCKQWDHTAHNYPKYHCSEIVANYSSASPTRDTKWLVDSGASHNITSDLSDLKINSEYDGTDEVILGDGSGL